jgi:hypothetical protein
LDLHLIIRNHLNLNSDLLNKIITIREFKSYLISKSNFYHVSLVLQSKGPLLEDNNKMKLIFLASELDMRLVRAED